MKLLMDYATTVRTCGPVPPNVYDAIQRYVEHGVEPGGFVRACLENDLRGAVSRADAKNKDYLQQICYMMNAAIPSMAHGSEKKVRTWLDGGWKEPGVVFADKPVSREEREHTL